MRGACILALAGSLWAGAAMAQDPAAPAPDPAQPRTAAQPPGPAQAPPRAATTASYPQTPGNYPQTAPAATPPQSPYYPYYQANPSAPPRGYYPQYGYAYPQYAPPAPASGMVKGETEDRGDRTLKGHTFVYPHLIDNAFTAWNFYVGSTLDHYRQGGVTAVVPSASGATTTTTFDRDITFAKLNYGFDFRPWENFTFGLDADYLGEVGTNGESLFTSGGAGGYEFRPNAKLRVLRSDRTGSQLALRFWGTFQGGIRAMPQGLLVDIANQLATANPQTLAACLLSGDYSNCSNTDVGADIKATRSRNGAGGAIAFAQALNRYLGAQLALGVEGASTTVKLPIGNGQTTSIDSSETVFYLGVAPSLNFYPKVPIGLSYEYRFELNHSGFDGNAQAGIAQSTSINAVSHRMGWGLYYTGRRDLMLGWIAGLSLLHDLIHSLQNAASDPTAVVIAAQCDMRYFF